MAVVFVAAGWFLLEKRKRELKRAVEGRSARPARRVDEHERSNSKRDERVARRTDAQIDRAWTHDHTLLMTNGEFIAYKLRHFYNIGTVDHLFLGHGSDGKWLYRTYHVCLDMAGARGDEAPGSIAEFMEAYFVREFDGKSAECLQHTWPKKRKRG